MKIKYIDRRGALVWLSSVGLAAGSALAADPYPSKPIRLIVPFPPGGSSDPISRLIGRGLNDAFGQPVII